MSSSKVDKQAVSLKKTLEKGDQSDSKYIWVTDFDDMSLEEFYEKFSELEQDSSVKIIVIFISSYGGETDVLAAMRDLIKSSSKPVSTIGLGKAMSCGASLLAAGSKGLRFASKNTSIMIHEISAGTEGKAEDIKQSAADIERQNKKFLKNLATDMGIPVQTIQKEFAKRKNADWTMTPVQAKALGLIDQIGVPRVVSRPEQVGISVTEEMAKISPALKKKLKT